MKEMTVSACDGDSTDAVAAVPTMRAGGVNVTGSTSVKVGTAGWPGEIMPLSPDEELPVGGMGPSTGDGAVPTVPCSASDGETLRACVGR